MAVAIKPIDSSSVHHIQSGQVIIDLCSVVRELIENSIDARATSIDVRFKNQGLELIEVQDNGSGIAPSNYASVALKHHTSKLSFFSDFASLKTFGFRGEALASLCALANVAITTCLQDDVPKGSRLSFEPSGRLKDITVVATQKGTTVSVDSLFYNLPVRRRELEQNIKREWEKVIVLLNQYACIQTNVKFTVSQQTAKQQRIVLFATRGNPSTRENIINIFGAKAISTLISLDLDLELHPSFVPGSKVRTATCLATSSHKIRIVGHVSRPSPGNGRQTPDRQMFFINGRPCRLPQFAKIFNDVYRSFNCVQLPFIFADILLDPHHYDVNVSPDKRSILLHEQSSLLDTLRYSLTAMFNSYDCAVPLSQPVATSDSNVKAIPTFSRNDCSANPRPKTFNFVSQEKRSRDSTTKSQIQDSEPVSGGTVSLFISSSPSLKPEVKETQKSRIDLVHFQSTDRLSPSPEVIRHDSEKYQTSMSELRSREDSDSRNKRQGKLVKKCSSKWGIIEGQSIKSKYGSHFTEVHNLGPVHHDIDSASSDQSSSQQTTTILDITAKNSMANTSSTPEDMQTSDATIRPEISKYRQGETSGKVGRFLNVLADFKLESAQRPVSNDFANSGASDFTATPRGDTAKAQERIELGDLQDHSIGTDFGEYTTNFAAKSASLNDAPTQPIEGGVKRNNTLMLATQYIQTNEASIRSCMDFRVPNRLAEQQPDSRFCEVEDIDACDAESKLTLTVSRSDFSQLQLVGQFNKGFIISRRPTVLDRTAIGDAQAQHDELFIIDQHASDEKYNFERLQVTAVVQSQKLVHPKRLQLSAIEEEIVKGNLTAIQANGFKISIDETGLLPVGSRCQVLALPLTRETTFDLQDLDELISLLRDETCNSAHIPRPSKIRKILAMRACRSSVMIGKALTRTQMYTLVRRMGTLDKPWNCPHGRPTMRHLCRLDSWEKKFWRCDSIAVAPSTWLSYSRTT